MIDFNLYKDKKQLKELIEIRDEINANRDEFHKLNDRITMWYYVKVLNFFIAIYKFIVAREENEQNGKN